MGYLLSSRGLIMPEPVQQGRAEKLGFLPLLRGLLRPGQPPALLGGLYLEGCLLFGGGFLLFNLIRLFR